MCANLPTRDFSIAAKTRDIVSGEAGRDSRLVCGNIAFTVKKNFVAHAVRVPDIPSILLAFLDNLLTSSGETCG